MKDSHHNDPRIFNCIINSKGKSADEHLTKASIHYRSKLRIQSNSLKCILYAHYKFST